MGNTFTERPLSAIRKVIAARMVEANQSIPHFRLGVDVEVDALIDLRRRLLQQRSESRLSLNDLIIKGTAAALLDVPSVNVQWVDGVIRQFHTADISVVVALADGLSTPIIRNADTKSVWAIAREVRELVARASSNTLKMAEIAGGSFSISNLGMQGIDEFDAIINPPQCAILAIGRASPHCLVGNDNGIRIANLMRVTLSADHRAIDGTDGAAFLSAFKQRIEKPAQLCQEKAP
jgi:pyruvate dehydrogenase E2 component (dihydrolipoamide acetyltransferase)